MFTDRQTASHYALISCTFGTERMWNEIKQIGHGLFEIPFGISVTSHCSHTGKGVYPTTFSRTSGAVNAGLTLPSRLHDVNTNQTEYLDVYTASVLYTWTRRLHHLASGRTQDLIPVYANALLLLKLATLMSARRNVIKCGSPSDEYFLKTPFLGLIGS